MTWLRLGQGASVHRFVLRPDEVAKRCLLSEGEVVELCKSGRLEHVKIGNSYRVIASLQISTSDGHQPVAIPKHPEVTEEELQRQLRIAVRLLGSVEVLRRITATSPRRPMPESLRGRVIGRDGRVCQYCGQEIGPRSKLTVDHIQPRSCGGTDELANLIVACATCNSRKGTSTGHRCECGRWTWEGVTGPAQKAHSACRPIEQQFPWHECPLHSGILCEPSGESILCEGCQ